MYELTAVVAHVAGDGSAGESKDSQEAEGHLVAHIRVCLHSTSKQALAGTEPCCIISGVGHAEVSTALQYNLHVYLHVHI